jgi:hypothetical protein
MSFRFPHEALVSAGRRPTPTHGSATPSPSPNGDGQLGDGDEDPNEVGFVGTKPKD